MLRRSAQYKTDIPLRFMDDRVVMALNNVRRLFGEKIAPRPTKTETAKCDQSNSARRLIRLFSPIPPLKTGTADYLDSLINEILSTSAPIDAFEIVVDEEMFHNEKIPDHYRGFKVVSYRATPILVTSDVTHVYFLANNEYHYYAHRSLYFSSKSGGRIVSVIHEPSNFMLFNTLCATGRYPFSDDQFQSLAAHQLGEQSTFWLRTRRAGNLPFEVEFGIMCQTHTLERSDEIWTHSRYAALKIILESPHHNGSMPRVVVSQHPHNYTRPDSSQTLTSPVVDPSSVKDGDGFFTVGIFGWVSPSKRVVQAFRAISYARAMLGSELRDKIRVIVVGQLPDPSHYDPKAVANEYGIADLVTFLGFAAKDEFVRNVSKCNLVLNLRYPSCGETSGTLQFASDLQIPVISTSFQAFRESGADFFVAPLEPLEVAQLSSHLWNLITNWASNSPPAAGSSHDGSSTPTFSNRFKISDLLESELHRH